MRLAIKVGLGLLVAAIVYVGVVQVAFRVSPFLVISLPFVTVSQPKGVRVQGVVAATDFDKFWSETYQFVADQHFIGPPYRTDLKRTVESFHGKDFDMFVSFHGEVVVVGFFATQSAETSLDQTVQDYERAMPDFHFAPYVQPVVTYNYNPPPRQSVH